MRTAVRNKPPGRSLDASIRNCRHGAGSAALLGRGRRLLGRRRPLIARVCMAGSQRIPKRIEEAFGWIKMIAGQEKTKLRGRERIGWAFTFAAAAYNLTRLPKLMAARRGSSL